jgi:hypothetical protein
MITVQKKNEKQCTCEHDLIAIAGKLHQVHYYVVLENRVQLFYTNMSYSLVLAYNCTALHESDTKYSVATAIIY